MLEEYNSDDNQGSDYCKNAFITLFTTPVDEILILGAPTAATAAALKGKVRLMSFNVYGNKCSEAGNGPTIIEFINGLTDKPDIICTQEEPLNAMTGHGYARVRKQGTGHEIVGVYKNEDKGGSITDIIPISTSMYSGPSGVKDRNAIIFNYNGIKIANIHLEGGKHVDANLSANFNAYLEYKLSLLTEVLKYKPDIILGDFNSQKFDGTTLPTKFVAHATKLNLTGDQMYKWNTEAFKLLMGNGYIMCNMKSNSSVKFTELRNNSIVDYLWYKGIECTDSKIIDINDGLCCNKSKNDPAISGHSFAAEHVNRQQKTFDDGLRRSTCGVACLKYVKNTQNTYEGDIKGIISDHNPIITTVNKKQVGGGSKEIPVGTKEYSFF